MWSLSNVVHCLIQLVERSKFKKVGHPERRGVLGSSQNNLQHYNKMLSYKKRSLSNVNIFINNVIKNHLEGEFILSYDFIILNN